MSGGQTQQGVDSQTRNLGLQNYQNAYNLSQKPFQAFDPNSINQYMNPYIQDVINSGDADLTKQNDQQLQTNASNAVHQNAFGGDRGAVADSMTNNDFANQKASFDANTRSAGFSQAEGTAMQNWQAQQQYPIEMQGLLNQSFGSSVLPTATQWSQQPFNWQSLLSSLGGDAAKYFAS